MSNGYRKVICQDIISEDYWTMTIEKGHTFFSVRLRQRKKSTIYFPSFRGYKVIYPETAEIEMYKMLYPTTAVWFDTDANDLYDKFIVNGDFILNNRIWEIP